jgi:hypothetical protein
LLKTSAAHQLPIATSKAAKVAEAARILFRHKLPQQLQLLVTSLLQQI